jgi:hypothetical protein
MTIFDAKKDATCFSGVQEIIVCRLKSGEWFSTTELYRACSMRVKRELLHAVLKELLQNRVLVMRVLNRNGRVTNEFKRAKA